MRVLKVRVITLMIIMILFMMSIAVVYDIAWLVVVGIVLAAGLISKRGRKFLFNNR